MNLQPETPSVSPKRPPRWQAPRHVFDRRTKAARRFALLVSEFTEQLGSADLSEARKAIVHQLASVIIAAEEMQAAVVRGEIVDTEQMVRLVNLQARLTRQLGLDDLKARPPRQRTLADHIAEHGRAA